MDNTFLIFGKAIRIKSSDVFISAILEKEMSLYPSLLNQDFNILIEQVDKVDVNGILSSNPGIHSFTENGFVYSLGPVVTRFYFEDGELDHIQFSIKHSGLGMRILRKWMNIQFTSHKEAVGQWLHEHILVPLAFTFPEFSVVHASAVQTKEGKTLLFGGTGGVGKTSLEINLCRDHNCSFVSDDICVVDSDGSAYPNLAYPKIYAYNIDGNPKVKKAIFKGRNLADKLQFKLHSLRGKNFIRRRISPEVFYGKITNSKTPISGFFILFRDQSSEISFEKITASKAANLNALVISREYNSFFDHLVWDEYNALAMDSKLKMAFEKILKNVSNNLEKGLSDLDHCYLVRIPSKISHTEYQTQMVSKLKSLGFV